MAALILRSSQPTLPPPIRTAVAQCSVRSVTACCVVRSVSYVSHVLCGCSTGLTDVKIKKGAELTKFKLRLSRYLYTLKVSDQAKADKIAQSFPPGLKKEDIK